MQLFVILNSMKTNAYLKLQKKFGGRWVATDKAGERVYSQSKGIGGLFAKLKKLGVAPQKTTIGYIEKYGQISAYFSLSIQKD